MEIEIASFRSTNVKSFVFFNFIEYSGNLIVTISMLLIEHSRAINTSASILKLPYQSLSIGK